MTKEEVDGEEEEPVTTLGGPQSPRAQVEFQCDKCDDAFNREFFLARHKKDEHNDWRFWPQSIEEKGLNVSFKKTLK